MTTNGTRSSACWIHLTSRAGHAPINNEKDELHPAPSHPPPVRLIQQASAPPSLRSRRVLLHHLLVALQVPLAGWCQPGIRLLDEAGGPRVGCTVAWAGSGSFSQSAEGARGLVIVLSVLRCASRIEKKHVRTNS